MDRKLIGRRKTKEQKENEQKQKELFYAEIKEYVAETQEYLGLSPTVCPTMDDIYRATKKNVSHLRKTYGVKWSDMIEFMGLRQKATVRTGKPPALCWKCVNGADYRKCVWVKSCLQGQKFEIPDGAEFKAGNGILSCPEYIEEKHDRV